MPQRTGAQARLRCVESEYSLYFILSFQGIMGGKMPDVMQHAMKVILSVRNDIEEICFEKLSDSLQAPLIFSAGDIPVRSNKLIPYIRVFSVG